MCETAKGEKNEWFFFSFFIGMRCCGACTACLRLKCVHSTHRYQFKPRVFRLMSSELSCLTFNGGGFSRNENTVVVFECAHYFVNMFRILTINAIRAIKVLLCLLKPQQHFSSTSGIRIKPGSCSAIWVTGEKNGIEVEIYLHPLICNNKKTPVDFSFLRKLCNDADAWKSHQFNTAKLFKFIFSDNCFCSFK